MPKVILATILLMSIVFLKPALAAESSSAQWRRGTATVLFAGVGGGVLGLSTLSFYGKPQEHAGNITMGGLLGVIGGLAYVFWDGGNTSSTSSMIVPRVYPTSDGHSHMDLQVSFLFN